MYKKKVLMLLIYTLINKFQVNDKINNDSIMLLIEPHIDLILLSVNLPKCKWCSSRPLDEEKVINGIKLNRLNNMKHVKLDIKEEILPDNVQLKLEAASSNDSNEGPQEI
jgi:hypothetical protein